MTAFVDLAAVYLALREAGWAVALDATGRPVLRGPADRPLPPEMLAELPAWRDRIRLDLERRGGEFEPVLSDAGVFLPRLPDRYDRDETGTTSPLEPLAASLWAAGAAAAAWVASAPPGAPDSLLRLVRGYAELAFRMAALDAEG